MRARSIHKRHQLKGGEQEGHAADPQHAAQALQARDAGAGDQRQQTDRQRPHVSVNKLAEEGEPEHDARESGGRAAAQRAEGESEGQQQEVRRHRLRKKSESGPDVAFVFQTVELGSGNQRGQTWRPRRR